MTKNIEAIARETVQRWRGKLSDPETFEYLYENILAAIETALAAEREKVAEVEDHNIRGVLHPDVLAKHEQQLAAAVEKAVQHPAELITKMVKLEKQLAAGREKVKALEDQVKVRGEMRDEAITEMTKSLKLLAVAVEALTFISEQAEEGTSLKSKADAALANVKEGK